MSVGTELLLGEILDSNAAYLANELKARGVTLHFKSVVGDNQGRIAGTLRLALSRADLILVGGGLGPTDDDLTREAIAEVAGETPEVSEDLLIPLRALFESRGRSFPEANKKQAWLIPSAQALPNPNGTAPGWFVRLGEQVIVAMPGPPREMQPMWREQVLPRLTLPQRALWSVTLHSWGLGESHLAERLGDLTQASNPSVATYARRHGVDVRVAASAASEEEARELAAPVLAKVEEALGDHLYGQGAETLAGIILSALSERGENVASVEAGGGVVGELLCEPALPSYAGGLIVTQRDTLLELGVTAGALASGTQNEAVALQLARGVRKRFYADWGVVSLSSEAEYVLAVAGPSAERASSVRWPTDRRTGIERAAHGALMLLLGELRDGGA